MGSSIVKHAFVAACRSPGGPNLNLSRVNISMWWQGYGGMEFPQVKSKLVYLSSLETPPDFLIIHCGGNNIGKMSSADLRQMIKNTLNFVYRRFPRTRIIWSQILPRRSWRYSDNTSAMENTRKRINSFAAKLCLAKGGAYIKYPDISLKSPSLFQNDGVHLSEVGNSIFLTTLQAALEHIVEKNWSVYPDRL